MLTLASVSASAFSGALPPVQQTFCADVVETLTIDSTPPVVVPGKNYMLCVDYANLRWNQRAADNSTLSIFNGTDIFQLKADSTAAGGWSCLTKTSGPEQPSFMPYRITTIDPGTAVNRTGVTFDGVKDVTDYWHFRQGQPPRTRDASRTRDLLAATFECLQQPTPTCRQTFPTRTCTGTSRPLSRGRRTRRCSRRTAYRSRAWTAPA